jgi:hypothetical protein
MERLGFRNDGMVPLASSVLLGSNAAIFRGVDHLASVMNAFVLRFDRVRLFKILLWLLSDSLPQPQATSVAASTSS